MFGVLTIPINNSLMAERRSGGSLPFEKKNRGMRQEQHAIGRFFLQRQLGSLKLQGAPLVWGGARARFGAMKNAAGAEQGLEEEQYPHSLSRANPRRLEQEYHKGASNRIASRAPGRSKPGKGLVSSPRCRRIKERLRDQRAPAVGKCMRDETGKYSHLG